MRKTIAMMLISTLVLSSCGMVRNSRLNPANWFGRASETQNVAPSNPLIPRRTGLIQRGPVVYGGVAVDRITSLVVERLPNGALIRIEAVADRQGSFNVLVDPDTLDEDPVDGVLSYTLKAQKPRRSPVGTEPSRRIVAARFVPLEKLAGVRTIRVAGARNTLTVRR